MTRADPPALPLPKRLWWPWNEPAEVVCFRRGFDAAEARAGVLYVACSGRYRAWLDGAELPVPAAHLPSWRSMHRIPLAWAAGAHELRLAAESAPNAQPFILACLDWAAPAGPARLATGAGWEMAAAAAPLEQVCADAPWRPAWAFDGVWSEPWGLPCCAPQDFGRLTTGWQEIVCEELVRVAGVRQGAAPLGARAQVGLDGSLALTPPLPYPVTLPKIGLGDRKLEWYRTREAHSLVNNTWLDLFEARCPAVVFDAGAETFASLEIRLRSGGPAVVAVTTGESLNEVDRYARRVTDVFELRDGESFRTAPTGFRYVKITALSTGTSAAVLAPPVLEHLRYPIPNAGSFRCSDPRLTEIFALSLRTMHLCMQTEIWDGVKRDQLPWMGDLYTEALSAYLLLGDARLARRSLAVLGELGPGATNDLAKQTYPGLAAIWRTKGGDINDIPAYTLWWVLGLWDYWQFTGDLSLAAELRAELQAVLAHIASWVDAGGVWRLSGGWDFVDWAPLTAEDRAVYCHLLAYRALAAGARLLEAAGLSAEQTAPIHAVRERMGQAARGLWWANGVGMFGAAHHANAQAVCSGIFSPAEARALFAQTLQADPPLSMTYWHRFLDLEAARQVGAVQWGLDYIRRHWGAALKMGMSALWEAFDPAWMECADPHAVSMVGAGYARYGGYETSLCHGWSSGPAAWLITAVLGLTPAAPGLSKVRFQPDLGDLDWAEGTLPTPFGPLTIRLERGQPARISAPDGVEVIYA